MSKENDYPTVRTGAHAILVFLAAVYIRAIIFNPDSELTKMAESLLYALATTHAILVAGASFVKSKWGNDNVVNGVTKRVETVEVRTDSSIKPNTGDTDVSDQGASK